MLFFLFFFVYQSELVKTPPLAEAKLTPGAAAAAAACTYNHHLHRAFTYLEDGAEIELVCGSVMR